MLGSHKIITTIAVNDIENAADFYGNVLGLNDLGKNSAGHLFECNGVTIGLYQSTAAGTGQATCVWWTVDDVDAVVSGLKERGVTFEKNYDLPHVTRKNDIYHMSETSRAAWFKDPDGNVLGFGNF